MVINTVLHARSRQKGVTLITVMIILVVITLLGISAMRMSLSSLTLATNSQVTNLLFQSADVGLVQVANEIKKDAGTADSSGGVLVDVIAGEGSEVYYCVTPKDAANTLTKGKCDVKNSAHFMSGRDAVATQVAVKMVDNTDFALGTDTSLASALVPIKIAIYSTAVLHSFGSATKSKINECFAKKNDDSSDTSKATEIVSVTDCLTDNGAVFNSQVDEATYGYKF